MLNAIKGVVREGKIELLETVDLPEGATVLVTVLGEEALWDEEERMWRDTAKKHCLEAYDTQDDLYDQL